MATAGPPCARCGWVLRWFPPKFAWVCDRCRAIYPASPPAAAPSPPSPLSPGAAFRAGRPAVAAIGAAAPPVLAAPGAVPFAATRLHAAGRARPRRRVRLGLAIAGVAVAVAAAWWLVAGSAEEHRAPRDREELVRSAVAALAAHDAKALLRLSDYDALQARMLDCDADDKARDRQHDNKESLRKTFEDEVERTKDTELAFVAISPPSGDDKAMPLHRGDNAGDDCKFKVDAEFNDINFTVKVRARGREIVQKASLIAIHLDGAWHLLGPPRIEGEIGEIDCAGAVKAALAVAKDELLKVPRMTGDKLEKLETSLAERCKLYSWDEEVRTCLDGAAFAGSLEGCLGLLPSSELTAVTDEISRIADAEE